MFFELDNRLLTLALQEIEDHTYQKLCLYENSDVNPFFSYELELKEGTRKHAFLAGFNANADYVNLSSNKFKYYKFKLPIDLMSWGDKLERKERVERPKYKSVYERGFLNRKGVEVYVDNKKLPDYTVLVSVHNGAFDLYVPDVFGIDDNSVIRVLVNEYKSNTKSPYCTFYVEINETHNNKFGFSMIEGRNIPISNDNALLFINGIAQLSHKFEATSKNSMVYLSVFEELKPGDIIELVYRPYRVHFEQHVESDQRALILPDDFLKDLPISPELMEVYIDGKRLLPNDLDIVNARHYRIPLQPEGHKPDIMLYIHYSGESIQSHHDYFDETLKYFKFKDANTVRNIIEQKYNLVEVTIPDYIKMEEDFPPEYISITQDISKLGLTRREFTEKTIEDYIRINPDNYRRLLRYFSAKNDINIDITDKYFDTDIYDRWDTSNETGPSNKTEFKEENTVFSIQKPTYDFELLVYSGSTKIYRHEVTRKDLLERVFIYVPKRYLKRDSYLRIEIVQVYNRKQKYFIRDTNIYGHEFFFNVSDFGHMTSMKDLVIYRKTDNGGWLAVNEGEIDIHLLDNDTRIYIKSNSLENPTYFIFNQRFFNYQLMNVPEGRVMDRIVFNYDSYSTEIDSFIPKYSYGYIRNFYTNQIKQAEGVDYTIISQNKDKEVDVARAILRTLPQENTYLESYNLELEQIALNIMGWVDTELGLIYINNMPVPFDLSYISVYINGIYMRPQDLIAISDNVLLIINPEVTLPIYKAEIVILVDIPKDELDKWNDIYEENDKYNDYVQDVVDPERDKESGSNIDDLITGEIAPVIPEWVDEGIITVPSFPPGWGLGVVDRGDGTISHIGSKDPIKDIHGNNIYLDESERIPVVDENGNRVYVDDEGNSYVVDDTGSLVPPTYDSNGNEYKKDENNNLIIVDKDGNNVGVIKPIYPIIEFPDLTTRIDPLYEALMDGWEQGTMERRIDATRECFAFNDVNLRVLMDEQTLNDGILRIDAGKRILTKDFRIDSALPEFLKQNPEILSIVYKAVEDGILPHNFTTLTYEEFEQLDIHNDIYPEDLQRVLKTIARENSGVIRIEPNLM